MQSKNSVTKSALELKRNSKADIVTLSSFPDLASPQKKHRVIVKSKNTDSEVALQRENS